MSGDRALADAFLREHPLAAAQELERYAPADVAPLLAELPAVGAGRVLAALPAAQAVAVLRAGRPAAAGAQVTAMPLAAAARALRRLDPAPRDALLAHVESRRAAALRRALTYAADTAAGVMDARGLSLPGHLRVAEALARFRRSDAQAGSYLYVVGDEDRLEGVIGLRELLAARRQSRLRDVATRDVAHLPAAAGRGAILDHPGWRRFHELPVVDAAGCLLGIVRHGTAERLRRAGGAADAGGASLTPWVHIGELYWTGMARVLGSLMSMLGGRRGGR